MKFKMTYPYPRLFEHLGEINPDEIVEADVNPDDRFFEPADVPAATPEPAPVAEPAAPAAEPAPTPETN